MLHPLLCLGSCFLLAGFVLSVISTASREWVLASDGSTSGLWISCFGTGSCLSLTREDALDAVRAMMVMSVIVSGIALMVIILDIASTWINGSTNRWALRLITVMAFLSAVLSLIGVLVSQRIDWVIKNSEYAYSFWLGVASIITFFVSGLLFLACVIRHHRVQNRNKKQTSHSAVKKEYPFTIPYYNYKSQEQQSNASQPKSSLETKDEGQKAEKSPFKYDYRYYPTTPVPAVAHANGDASFINESSRGSHDNPGSPTSQFPRHLLVGNRNSEFDSYHGSQFSKSQRTNNTMSTPRNISSNNITTSGFNVHSVYSRSSAASRMPRDAYGYPLNYNRDV